MVNSNDQSRTPFELATGKKPDIEGMRVFGSIGYAHIPRQKRSKLENTSIKVKMLGYPKDQMGYRVMEVDTGKILVTRSVKWDEDAKIDEEFIQDIEDSEDDEEIQESEVKTEAKHEDIWRSPPGSPFRTSQPTKMSETPDRFGQTEAYVRPARKKKAIIRYQDEFDGLVCLMAEATPDEAECLAACEDQDERATSFQEIMKSKHREE